MDASREKAEVTSALQQMAFGTASFLHILVRARQAYLRRHNRKKSKELARYNLISRIPAQVAHLRRIINISDADCIENLRMSRNAFSRLCYLLESVGGLTDTRNVTIHEKVAIFLTVLGHRGKNQILKQDFVRSGYTVSKYFHEVLDKLFKLYPLLIVPPEPVPEDCTDERWKWFKGCLGAIDCTHINVKVAEFEKARYRTRKGDIAVNVLGVCNPDMKFIYVLSGWEGSASDDRVLSDALSRKNGLNVPNGNYYLCDGAYRNGNGFLTPYRGVKVESSSLTPQNKEQLFNLKHSCALNVMERTFRLLKMRWEVLGNNSYYSIKVQNRIIMACALLHNFIRTEMPVDPLEQQLEENLETNTTWDGHIDVIDAGESQVWSSWRNELANSMFNEWRCVQ
ncbi:PREDICTED: uncharacterized protein LOC105977997 [Erythranthe guttata]|uniref:uncharacterized protein LOC105977997 n=1 Tax=Erythranthe guttata TaxID=4155 RepID=UPI00064E0BBD|nr:PREDICTED: uncharacterized protein LOC105977997 [Erythranthe guttata]|eukprot:XP_012858855.1 PREDICTED: uncharacterized protein LOC105977997 [Erythranthe guttata]